MLIARLTEGNPFENLTEQNMLEDQGEEITVKFKTGSRMQKTVHWVIHVSPGVRHTILSEGCAYIEYTSVKFKDTLL